jgi:hypothetical protein
VSLRFDKVANFNVDREQLIRKIAVSLGLFLLPLIGVSSTKSEDFHFVLLPSNTVYFRYVDEDGLSISSSELDYKLTEYELLDLEIPAGITGYGFDGSGTVFFVKDEEFLYGQRYQLKGVVEQGDNREVENLSSFKIDVGSDGLINIDHFVSNALPSQLRVRGFGVKGFEMGNGSLVVDLEAISGCSSSNLYLENNLLVIDRCVVESYSSLVSLEAIDFIKTNYPSIADFLLLNLDRTQKVLITDSLNGYVFGTFTVPDSFPNLCTLENCLAINQSESQLQNLPDMVSSGNIIVFETIKKINETRYLKLNIIVSNDEYTFEIS